MKLPLFAPTLILLAAPLAHAQTPDLQDDDLGPQQVEVDTTTTATADGTATSDTTVEMTDDDAADAAAVAAPDVAGDPVAAGASLADVLNGDTRFTTLISLIQAAGLESDLAEALPLTVFAPTNAAFEELGEGMVKNLMEPDKREDLRGILKHHMVSGSFTLQDLEEGQLTTLAGDNIQLLGAGGEATVDGYPIVTADLTARDGVVHAIDRVLLPLEVRDGEAAIEEAAAGPGSTTQSAIDDEDSEVETIEVEAATGVTTDATGATGSAASSTVTTGDGQVIESENAVQE